MFALQWLLWLHSALSRSLMFLNKGVHVLVLTKLPSLEFIFNLLLSHFDLLIFSESLIFLLLYFACFDVFGCSQLNWPWHFKQCFVAPELSHFSLCCLVVQLFRLSILSLFNVCALRYNCSLMHKHLGNN